jgi:hypothetical protein
MLHKSQSPPVFCCFCQLHWRCTRTPQHCCSTAIVSWSSPAGLHWPARSRQKRLRESSRLSPFHVVVAGLRIDFPVQMTISQWVPMYAFSDLCTPIPLKYLTCMMETLFFSYLRSGSTFNFQCSNPSNGSNSILCVSVHVQVKYTMTWVMRACGLEWPLRLDWRSRFQSHHFHPGEYAWSCLQSSSFPEASAKAVFSWGKWGEKLL